MKAILFTCALLGLVSCTLDTEPPTIVEIHLPQARQSIDLKQFRGVIIANLSSVNDSVVKVTFCRQDSLWSSLYDKGLFEGFGEGDTIQGYKPPVARMWVRPVTSGDQLWWDGKRYIRIDY